MSEITILIAGILSGAVVGLFLFRKVTTDQEFLEYLAKKKPHLVKKYRVVEDKEA